MITNDPPLRCSFCGKSQKEVEKLIAGPNAFICNECTELSFDILLQENVALINTSHSHGKLLQTSIRLARQNTELMEEHDKIIDKLEKKIADWAAYEEETIGRMPNARRADKIMTILELLREEKKCRPPLRKG